MKKLTSGLRKQIVEAAKAGEPYEKIRERLKLSNTSVVSRIAIDAGVRRHRTSNRNGAIRLTPQQENALLKRVLRRYVKGDDAGRAWLADLGIKL
jgi:hypothetical protein